MKRWQRQTVWYILLIALLLAVGCSGGGIGGGTVTYSIAGLVTDDQGTAIADVAVAVLGAQGHLMETTDEYGAFEFSGLKGSVEVQVQDLVGQRAFPNRYEVHSARSNLEFVVHQIQPLDADVSIPNHGFVVFETVALDFSQAVSPADTKVRVAASSIGPRGDMTQIGPVVQLQTSAVFSGLVAVQFAVDQPDVGAVFAYEETEDVWNVLPGSYEGGIWTVELPHFSVYGVMDAPRAEPPTVQPFPGSHPAGTTVELVGENVYYSLDGSKPDLNSARYTSTTALEVGSHGLVLKAVAVEPNHLPSAVESFIYTVGTVETNVHHFRDGEGYVKELTQRPFFIGDYITLEVVPNAGWEFDGWKEAVLDDLGDQRYGFYLQQETTLTAQFTSDYVYTFDKFIPNDSFTPNYLALDSDHLLYISDTSADTIIVLGLDGNVIREFGTSGTAPGQLGAPRGIAVDEDGSIYVAEESNRRVQKFTSQGAYIRHWDMPTLEHDSGYDWAPAAVAVDESGLVYVACDHLGVGRSMVFVFASDSSSLMNSFDDGVPFSLSSLAFGPEGRLFVAGGHEISVHTAAGQLLFSFGGYGSGPGEFNVIGELAVAEDGIIVASDTWNHRLQMFNSQGEFLTSWGTGAGVVQGPSRLWLPSGVAVDSGGHVVFVEMWRLKRIVRDF